MYLKRYKLNGYDIEDEDFKRMSIIDDDIKY